MANEKILQILGQEVTIFENQYFLINNSNDKVVLRNSTLMDIGNQFNIPRPTFEFIENQRDFGSDKFSYVVKARIEENGKVFEQVGEANHLNCLNDIALAHPATMAMVRATSRVLIRALGLEGSVYSEEEFNKEDLKKPSLINNTDSKKQSQKSDNKTPSINQQDVQNPQKEKSMTKEEAGEVPITVGYLAQQKAKVKDCNEKNINYILALKSDKYNDLKKAIRIYWNI